MRSKIIFFGVLSVLLCFIGFVYAQEGQQSPDSMVAKMKSELSLSQDEADAIKPIIQGVMIKRQALKASMESGSIDKGDMRTQMQQLRDEENQELSQILTADEMSKWQNIQSQMKQGRGHRHGGEGGE